MRLSLARSSSSVSFVLGFMIAKRLLTGSFFCLLLLGCDRGYPPVIVSEYTKPIQIALRFNHNVNETGITLPPSVEFVQRRKNLEIQEIVVKEPSGATRTYSANDFQMARSARTVDVEVWVLTQDGLRLEGQDYLRKLFKDRGHR